MKLPKKERRARTVSPAAAARASNHWEWYWFGSVASIRPYLLMKAVFFILAFDLWMVRLPSGWRFGLDPFNVAHFQWLDNVQPLPTASLYNGLLLLVGILSFVCAIAGAGLLARVVLALAYTYTWAQSMLDDFQHHYFLSLILLPFIFFPIGDAKSLYPEPMHGSKAHKQERWRVSAWAYVLIAANISLLYIFTAIAKAEEPSSWKLFRELFGHRKVSVEAVEAWFISFGISAEWLWLCAVWSVIALEIMLAVTYFFAIKQDENPRPWLRIATWAGVILAVFFHGMGNEFLLLLRIGLFSYYMIVFALIYFLPESILWNLGKVATWPARRLAEIWLDFWAARTAASAKGRISLTTIGALVVAILAVQMGFALDLPGGAAAGVCIAIFLATVPVMGFSLRRFEGAERYVLATGLAIVAMWIAVADSTVRSHYYRRLTEHYESKGNHEAAKQSDTKAKLYASKE